MARVPVSVTFALGGLSAGTCSLTADQAGDLNYTAAPQETLDVTIGTATQAITSFIATPSAPTYAPGGTFNLSATGGASTSPVLLPAPRRRCARSVAAR